MSEVLSDVWELVSLEDLENDVPVIKYDRDALTNALQNSNPSSFSPPMKNTPPSSPHDSILVPGISLTDSLLEPTSLFTSNEDIKQDKEQEMLIQSMTEREKEVAMALLLMASYQHKQDKSKPTQSGPITRSRYRKQHGSRSKRIVL